MIYCSKRQPNSSINNEKQLPLFLSLSHCSSCLVFCFWLGWQANRAIRYESCYTTNQNILDFYSLCRHHHYMGLNNRSSLFINDNLWMKSTNVHVLFWVRKASTKNIIHPFRKAQSQKSDKNVKQATLKGIFLIKVSFTRAPYVGAEWVWLNTSTTQKMVPTYMYLYHFMQNTL